MSKIKVNSIVNKNDDGEVELTRGAIIPPGQQLSVSGNFNVTGILTAANYNVTSMNVSGVVTASAFIGDGSGLTSLPTVSIGKIIAYKKIFSFEECYRA